MSLRVLCTSHTLFLPRKRFLLVALHTVFLFTLINTSHHAPTKKN